MAYINNVLYYIDQNLKRSSEDKLIEVSKLLFPEKEIIEAKQYLLDNCQSVLLRLNKTLADEVKKGRKNTENRPKVDVTIKDIIDILECFIGNEQKLEIKAKNLESIPKVSPESVNLISVVTRLEEISKEISKDDIKLHSKCECDKVKEENVLLKNQVEKIEQKFQNLEKILAELQIAHVLPRSSPVPTSDLVNPMEANTTMPVITDGNVDNGLVANAKTNSENIINVSGSDSNSTLLNNGSLSVEQIGHTNKEKGMQGNNIIPPVDNLTALGHASDTCPVPDFEIVANAETSVTVATIIPTENTTIQQNIVVENSKVNANTNA